MEGKIVIIAGIFLVGLSLISYVLLLLINKEHRKQLKDLLEKTREDWAKALESVERLKDKEADALKYAISCKDDIIDEKNKLIVEKNKRIEQLESDIAMKEFLMAQIKLSDTGESVLGLLKTFYGDKNAKES